MNENKNNIWYIKDLKTKLEELEEKPYQIAKIKNNEKQRNILIENQISVNVDY